MRARRALVGGVLGALTVTAVGAAPGAAALPPVGETALPLPVHGYTGDIFGTTLDLRKSTRLVVRPREVKLGNEEVEDFRRLSWVGWGTSAAAANGVAYRCTDFTGCVKKGTGTVRVARPVTKTCQTKDRSVRVYTRVGFLFPGDATTRWYAIRTPAHYC